MSRLSFARIEPLQDALDHHPVYQELGGLEDLRVFMAHHVYAVWDFMSLLKYLQQHVAPVRVPWLPEGRPDLRRFVNQLVLDEETDEAPAECGGPRYLSHFELYLKAMEEVGAEVDKPQRFLEQVKEKGVDQALESDRVPEPARHFTATTFRILAKGQPHAVAAALAVGRERVILGMFRHILEGLGVGSAQAPAFHYYLERHIHLDEDTHTPLALELVDMLCADDPRRLEEAAASAEEAIRARLHFWDGVRAAILAARR